MSWVYLSHFLDEGTPGFGGSKNFSRDKLKSMSSGDASNSFAFSMSNHHGTHIDLPKHFVKEGRDLSTYRAEELMFRSIGMLSHRANEDEFIGSEVLDKNKLASTIDLLLVKTDWTQFRNESKYWEHNPGFSAEFAEAARKRFPNLRALGFDFISLTAFQHREEGRRAHRSFLAGSRPLLIIEDMNLQNLNSSPKQVIVAPILIANADGAPVTILAEL